MVSGHDGASRLLAILESFTFRGDRIDGSRISEIGIALNARECDCCDCGDCRCYGDCGRDDYADCLGLIDYKIL